MTYSDRSVAKTLYSAYMSRVSFVHTQYHQRINTLDIDDWPNVQAFRKN